MTATKEPHALPEVAGKYVHEYLELLRSGATHQEAVEQVAKQNGVPINYVLRK